MNRLALVSLLRLRALVCATGRVLVSRHTGLLALALLCAACSTMPLLTVVEDHKADAGGPDATVDKCPSPFTPGCVDAGRFDGGIGFDGGFVFDGSFPPPDASFFFDAGFPFEASVPDAGIADFDYECTLYGISPNCRTGSQLPPNCSGAPLGDVCFNLPGFGYAQMYECRSDGFGRPNWAPSYRARCAYNCPLELPSGGFFSLDTSNCAQRPAQPCEDRESGTTQDAVDATLREIALRCGFDSISSDWSVGITVNKQGCPEWFHSSRPRVPAMISQCLSKSLEALRFECAPACSVTSAFSVGTIF